MARFARYTNVTPVLFGTMTPAQSRALAKQVDALLDDEWEGYVELAKLAGITARGR